MLKPFSSLFKIYQNPPVTSLFLFEGSIIFQECTANKGIAQYPVHFSSFIPYFPQLIIMKQKFIELFYNEN
jgi:hypothetical protein